MRSEYITIKEFIESEDIIRGSRFISCAYPCGSDDDLNKILNDVRIRHPDATHYCYAAIFSKNDRFSDNGEPSGTAGRPILQVLKGSGIDDVAVVIVRYFGGTLLGTGGLVQAYSNGASDVIRSVSKVRMVHCSCHRMTLSYNEFSRFEKECRNLYLGRPEQDFSDVVRIKCSVPDANNDKFIETVTDITNGNVHIETVSESYEVSG